MENILGLNQNDLTTKEEDKKLLEECLDELFSKEESEEIRNESLSPEVRFTKFLWKINFIEQEIEKHSKVAEETIKEVNDWFEQKKDQLKKQIEFLSNQMQNYLRVQDRKSLALPSGKIGFRIQQDKIEVADPDLFYSKATPDLLRHIPESYEPDILKIKSHIKTNGDIPSGVEVSPQAPKFYYKLNKKGE